MISPTFVPKGLINNTAALVGRRQAIIWANDG